MYSSCVYSHLCIIIVLPWWCGCRTGWPLCTTGWCPQPGTPPGGTPLVLSEWSAVSSDRPDSPTKSWPLDQGWDMLQIVGYSVLLSPEIQKEISQKLCNQRDQCRCHQHFNSIVLNKNKNKGLLITSWCKNQYSSGQFIRTEWTSLLFICSVKTSSDDF